MEPELEEKRMESKSKIREIKHKDKKYYENDIYIPLGKLKPVDYSKLGLQEEEILKINPEERIPYLLRLYVKESNQRILAHKQYFGLTSENLIWYEFFNEINNFFTVMGLFSIKVFYNRLKTINANYRKTKLLFYSLGYLLFIGGLNSVRTIETETYYLKLLSSTPEVKITPKEYFEFKRKNNLL